MTVTLSHNKSCGNDFQNEFRDEWNWAITQYIETWNKFYRYWVDIALNKKLPCIFIRYEDLA